MTVFDSNTCTTMALYPNLNEVSMLESITSVGSFGSFLPGARSSGMAIGNNESNETMCGTANGTQYRTAMDQTEETMCRFDIIRIQDEVRRDHQSAMYMPVHEKLRL